MAKLDYLGSAKKNTLFKLDGCELRFKSKMGDGADARFEFALATPLDKKAASDQKAAVKAAVAAGALVPLGGKPGHERYQLGSGKIADLLWT